MITSDWMSISTVVKLLTKRIKRKGEGEKKFSSRKDFFSTNNTAKNKK